MASRSAFERSENAERVVRGSAMKLRGGKSAVVAASLASLASFAIVACGSGGDVEHGYWEGAPAPASAPSAVDAGAPFDAGWPTVDPNPSGTPTGGAPSFGIDAAAPSASARTCTGKTGPLGDSIVTLQSSGGLRDAYVHIPSSYDPTNGTMLVLNFHGFSSNAPEEEVLAEMNPVADARDFIVAYPDGVAASFNAGTCCGVAWTNSVDDVQFTKDLLAKIEDDYCIDASRVYATGMSNGGFMSHRLACAMADVFAAVAPVAGVLGIPADQCNPVRPIPILDFHGTSDPVVPFAGGPPVTPLLSPLATFDSVDDTIATWRSKDSCVATPATIYSNGDATCTEFGGCRGGADIVQCVIDGGGHTWPGGVPIPPLGKTSTDISATNTMIDFFVAHPMPSVISPASL
jgi:polyhydroxybutyrate depolymerase